MSEIRIRSALISVYHKDGLDAIIQKLHALGVQLYSTGGTQEYITSLGIPVTSVESLTDYPSILDGRVKTLHPKVFGGILARREPAHLAQLEEYAIPPIDLVIVDLYPFAQTLRDTSEERAIIEKIDIGGISLIRAAAKNYKDVAVVGSQEMYPVLLEILEKGNGVISLEERHRLAESAFSVSSHYDTLIHGYFQNGQGSTSLFDIDTEHTTGLRYGENPHQQATFYGDLTAIFDQLSGKELLLQQPGGHRRRDDAHAGVRTRQACGCDPQAYQLLWRRDPRNCIRGLESCPRGRPRIGIRRHPDLQYTDRHGDSICDR